VYQVPNIAMWEDLISLPKPQLKDICIDLGLSEKGSVDELCDRIWQHISPNSELQIQALGKSKEYLLGGKTSITWFTFDEELTGLKNKIVEELKEDIFNKMVVPSGESITADPVIFSGAIGNSADEYYIRFIQRIGNTRNVYVNQISYRPRTATTTVYFDERKKFLEVRAEPKRANKIAQSIARLLKQQISMEQVKVAAPYGYSAERIADALNGELFDAKAKPELLLENFNEEHAAAVVEILRAIDNYFDNEDIGALSSSLESTKEKFGEEYLKVPFAALIVNGLDKIGMGVSERDLRGMPFYDYFKPHLQPQGGYIRFPQVKDGLTTYHTIRIGLTTNSVQFVTPATESVIGYVRNCLVSI